jgi:hypothetical protein
MTLNRCQLTLLNDIPECMVHEHTQTIEGQGTQNTMSMDDDDIPIVSFMNVKTHKSKKK